MGISVKEMIYGAKTSADPNDLRNLDVNSE